jgi:hypothetical protein
MKTASKLVMDAWKCLHNAVMESITNALRLSRSFFSAPKTPSSLRQKQHMETMIYTIDLRKALHYDINNMKYSLSIWASDDLDKLRGKWFFVLPNVRVELSNGEIYDRLIIVLNDCVQILWDGRVL